LGGIIHLGNIDGNITGIYDTLSLEFENLFNGKFSTIAIADFDGNDTLDYLLGNVRGGFNLYSYQSQDTLISSDEIASSIGNAIEIFPNPFSSNINITFNFDVPNAQIRIFDRLGRLVFQKEFDRPDKFLSLDLDTLGRGFYIVEVHTQHTRQISKLLKK